MFLDTWKARLIFCSIWLQAALLVGGFYLMSHSEAFFSLVSDVYEAKSLHIAVEAAEEGAKSPLRNYGVTTIDQLRQFSQAAQKKADTDSEILKKESAFTFRAWRVISVMETFAILSAGFLVGGVFRKKEPSPGPI